MFYYLLLFCFPFSPTTFGHHDGYTELKENTTTVILTSNATYINLEPQTSALMDFWIKTSVIQKRIFNDFAFYIDPTECINQTVSTSFIIGGGNWFALKFDFTAESIMKSLVDVTLTNVKKFNFTLKLEEQKIKVTLGLKHGTIIYNDIQTNKTDYDMYTLGNVVKFPFHGKSPSEPRVTFIVFNTGTCNISYEMSRDDMVPLTVDKSSSHHHDATTTPTTTPAATLISTTTTKEIQKNQSNEKWYIPYEGSTIRKIVYAYIWVLSCALAFIIGICAGQSKSKPRPYRTNQVQSVEPQSTSV